MEDALPPQFAQAVGLGFALGASVSMLFAWTLGVWIFAGSALFAAALNALFGFCLGCEIYLRIQRFLPESAIPSGQRRLDESAEPQWTGRPEVVDLTDGARTR
jgi:zinc transporter ZupT